MVVGDGGSRSGKDLTVVTAKPYLDMIIDGPTMYLHLQRVPSELVQIYCFESLRIFYLRF